MAGDLFLGNLERRGNGVARGLRVLRAGPAFAPVGRDRGDGCRRLHGRVRQMRCVVLCCHFFRCARERGGHVALLPHHASRCARRRLDLRAIRLRVVTVVRARRPGDFERTSSLHGRPRAVGNDGYATQRLEAGRDWRGRQLDDALNTLHLERRRGVDGGDARAIYGRMEDDRDLHPGEFRVLPEDRLAREDVVQVESGNVLADVAELRRVLELGRSRHGEGPRTGNELAERQRTARRGVHHGAVARRDVTLRHAPLRSGRLLEHLARGRAGEPEARKFRPANARRAVGVLVAELRVTRRLFKVDGRPVGLELVGDHHAESRAHTLAHLRAVAGDRDYAVLADAQQHGRLQRTIRREELRHRFEPANACCADGEHQAASGEPLQEYAALEIGCDRHSQRPPVDAATIAARMRVYVPQRQITGDIARSMSASVGFGVFLRSAAAAIIWPAWQ